MNLTPFWKALCLTDCAKRVVFFYAFPFPFYFTWPTVTRNVFRIGTSPQLWPGKITLVLGGESLYCLIILGAKMNDTGYLIAMHGDKFCSLGPIAWTRPDDTAPSSHYGVCINMALSWFRISRAVLIFERLPSGLRDRGLLILLLPDISPASVTGIFRGLGSWVVARSLLNLLCLHHCTQLVWCHHVRGDWFLIRCCTGDVLWLVCRYSPSLSDRLNCEFLNNQCRQPYLVNF